jgi:hypothetical protein
MYLSNGTLPLATFCLSKFLSRIILHQSEDLHKLLAFRQPGYPQENVIESPSESPLK